MIKILVQLTAHHSGIFPNRKCLPSGGNLLVWSSHIFAIHEQTSGNWKHYTTILKISSTVRNTFLFSTYESHTLATNRFCPKKQISYGMNLTTHLHLVPKLRTPPLPQKP